MLFVSTLFGNNFHNLLCCSFVVAFFSTSLRKRSSTPFPRISSAKGSDYAVNRVWRCRFLDEIRNVSILFLSLRFHLHVPNDDHSWFRGSALSSRTSRIFSLPDKISIPVNYRNPNRRFGSCYVLFMSNLILKTLNFFLSASQRPSIYTSTHHSDNGSHYCAISQLPIV